MIPVICSYSATCGLFTENYLYISNTNEIYDYKKIIEMLFMDYKKGDLKIKLENSYKLAKKYSEDKIVKQTTSVYKSIIKN